MKDIKGYEGLYAITRDGKVWSYPKRKCHRNGIWLKHGKTTKGYSFVCLSKHCIVKNFSIHKLVAMTYIPNPRNLKEINHKNSIRDDNRVKNLEWCTRLENIIHSFQKGFRKEMLGETHPNSKLKKKDILKIRELYKKSNLFQREIGDIFGVSRSVISEVINRKAWKHVN